MGNTTFAPALLPVRGSRRGSVDSPPPPRRRKSPRPLGLGNAAERWAPAGAPRKVDRRIQCSGRRPDQEMRRNSHNAQVRIADPDLCALTMACLGNGLSPSNILACPANSN